MGLLLRTVKRKCVLIHGRFFEGKGREVVIYGSPIKDRTDASKEDLFLSCWGVSEGRRCLHRSPPGDGDGGGRRRRRRDVVANMKEEAKRPSLYGYYLRMCSAQKPQTVFAKLLTGVVVVDSCRRQNIFVVSAEFGGLPPFLLLLDLT